MGIKVEDVVKNLESIIRYVEEQAEKGGYLSVDGKRLLQHTKQSINELKNLRKKIIK